MKVVQNNKTIRRNTKIGRYITYFSLAVLALGLIITFYWKDQILLSWLAILIGFISSQIGIYFSKRWGRTPIPYETITQSLKGLDDRYTLYHYITAAPHLLVGPAGILPILPYTQPGTITYDQAKNRYRQQGGNAIFKLFGQEGLGRPDEEAKLVVQDLSTQLSKKLESAENIPLEPVLVFINPKVSLNNEGSPFEAVVSEKLKDLVRRKTKTTPLKPDVYEKVNTVFPQESIE